MKNNSFTPSTELCRTIISRVLEVNDSPYKRMMQKANDIDIDFFEDISRDTETLPAELNMELKYKVLDSFKEMSQQLFVESGLEQQLIEMVKESAVVVKNTMGTEAYVDYMHSIANEIFRSAGGLTIEEPVVADAELRDKFEAAKRITMKELVLRNNKADVIAFHHALMERTWWECRELIAEQTKSFLRRLANSISEL